MTMSNNDTALKKLVLDSTALGYIRSQMSRGHALAQTILKTVNLEEGTVFVFLPQSVPREQALEFNRGGMGRIKTDWYLPKYVLSQMSAREEASLVFEHPYAHPTDPYLLDSTQNFFFHKLEVYFFLSDKKVTLERIISTVRAASGWPFIGAITAFSVPENYHRRTVSEKALEIVAGRVTHLIVGAYDNENELIWRRRPDPVEEGDL